MKTPTQLCLVALAIATVTASAHAKLPPPSEEAKAAAAAAADKASWSNKVAGYQLCAAQDRVAAAYLARVRAAGKEAPAPLATAPCVEPGPYVAAEAAKPIEAAGAHSPAATSKGPPSTSQPAADAVPAKKP